MKSAVEKELRAEINGLKDLVHELVKFTGLDSARIERMRFEAALDAANKGDRGPLMEYLERENRGRERGPRHEQPEP